MKAPLLAKTSLDWSVAQYETAVEVKENQVHIQNILHKSTVLPELIAKDQAKWVTEIRSPYTFYNISHITKQNDYTVEFDSTAMAQNFFIRPLLCAVEKIALPTDELNTIYQEEKSIEIMPGTILAEDLMWEDKDVLSSLFSFEVVENKNLNDGQLEVESRLAAAGKTPYVVQLNKKTMKIVNQRNNIKAHQIWIGALVGVFGEILKEAAIQYGAEENSDIFEQRVFQRIQEALGDENSWEEDEWKNFDPLKAATALCPFPIALLQKQAEDEGR